MKYRLTEDLYYYSNVKNDNVVAEAGTIIESTGRRDAKAGDEFIVNGEEILITDADEIIEEV